MKYDIKYNFDNLEYQNLPIPKAFLDHSMESYLNITVSLCNDYTELIFQ